MKDEACELVEVDKQISADDLVSALAAYLRAGGVKGKLWVCIAEIQVSAEWPINALGSRQQEPVARALRVAVIVAPDEQAARANFAEEVKSFTSQLQHKAVEARPFADNMTRYKAQTHEVVTPVAEELIVAIALTIGMSPPLDFARQWAAHLATESESPKREAGEIVALTSPREL